MKVKVFIEALVASSWAQDMKGLRHAEEKQDRTHKTGREGKKEMKMESASIMPFIKTSRFFCYLPILLEFLHHCSD